MKLIARERELRLSSFEAMDGWMDGYAWRIRKNLENGRDDGGRRTVRRIYVRDLLLVYSIYRHIQKV